MFSVLSRFLSERFPTWIRCTIKAVKTICELYLHITGIQYIENDEQVYQQTPSHLLHMAVNKASITAADLETSSRTLLTSDHVMHYKLILKLP